jgi:hypothetical protein
LPASTGAISQQCTGTGSSGDQATGGASQHFRSFWGAWRTIAGYEAIHMIRKGQACWRAVGAKVGLLHRFIVGMFGLEV